MMRTALALALGGLSALAACSQAADDPADQSGESGGRSTEAADVGDGDGARDVADPPIDTSGTDFGIASNGDLTASTTTDLAAKRYVASGDRAYVIGAADGSFAPMGWHIRGEMGGVWAHPIKLLDGYWFALDGTWLPEATRYTTGMGWASLEFPEQDGLTVTRTEVSPEGSPVVLIGLRVSNDCGSDRDVELTMDVRSELMGAYPWGWTMPNAGEANGADQGVFDDQGRLVFEEPDKPWRALVGASPAPAAGEVGDDFWGPVPAAERPDYLEFGNGTGGQLSWTLSVDDGDEATVWIAVAGSHVAGDAADTALAGALADPDKVLADKIDGRRDLLALSKVKLPDDTLELAFDWAKLNMADLRRTVTDLELRDVDEGRAYPDPVATMPTATGIGAGFPDYPWLFGTDGAYTSFPLIAAGQWDTAREHLRAIRDVSIAINGDTGKVVHEVITDGSVYFGSNTSPGNSNETAQFAVAVDLLWRWSGDDELADEMLPFIDAGVRNLFGTLDADGDGWPEGFGMVERGGMGSEKLDVTSYTWAALGALERLATARGEAKIAAWAAERAAAMEAAFVTAWWMPSISRYADSLCNEGDDEDAPPDGVNVCEAPDTQLQQQHWINATPMEMAFGPTEMAIAALESLEAELSGPCGLFHTGEGGGPDGAGELKCWTLPTSVMAVAEANYGRLGEDQAMRYIDSIAGLLDLEMPGALPEIAASPDYDPFADFRDRAMFQQAWSAYGVQWPVVRHFLGVDPDIPAGALSVVPQIPDGWPRLSIENLRVGDGTAEVKARRNGNKYTTEVEAPKGLDLTIGHTLPADAEVERVRLDGEEVEFDVVDTTRGREVRVTTTTSCGHKLEVKAR
jgi:glycogen debranching enzyme